MSTFQEIQMEFERYCQIDARRQGIDNLMTVLNEAKSWPVISSQDDLDRVTQERKEYSEVMGQLEVERQELNNELVGVVDRLGRFMLADAFYCLEYQGKKYKVYPRQTGSTRPSIEEMEE